MISRIINFMKTGIWEIRLKGLSPVKALFVRYLRIVILAVHEFRKDDCSRRASALTFYTLLNIVPVAAMVFGIAKGFGLEKLIESQIMQIAQKTNLQTDVTMRIITFSHSLLENTKGGLIAGVGVILLFWTIISILGIIEESFNAIWEVRQGRTLVRKFSDYITMMVFAPLLLIVSGSVTVVVSSRVRFIVHTIALLGDISSIIFFLLQLLPYLSIWVLLVLLYLGMPNTKVPLKSGILAGIVAGTLYQVIQGLYIKFQIGVTIYGAIYGSFVALPLFLAWLQLSWMIVLFGAEIAFASEHYETFGFQPDYSQISIASKKFIILEILQLVIKRFLRGEKPSSTREIAHTLEIPVRLVRQLLSELTGVGLVVETVEGMRNEAAFQPGRAIESITIKYALDAYEQQGGIQIPVAQSGEAEKISLCLKNISNIIEKTPGNVSLKEI